MLACPPFVAQKGLFDLPTLVNNVETVVWIPIPHARGAEWFASHGRHGLTGLRSFSVSGRVRRPGVHLAPAGITLAARVDALMPEGMVFVRFCYAEAAANVLTNPALDPFGKIPEFKYAVSSRWHDGAGGLRQNSR